MSRRVGAAAAAMLLACGPDPSSAQMSAATESSAIRLTITLEDAARPPPRAAELKLPPEDGAEGFSSPAASAAESKTFAPADFARPNRLEALQFEVDDLPRRTTAAAVRCQALIDVDGSLDEYYCVADDNRLYRRVVTSVIDAIPAQRFVAAREDGRNVRVLMSFAVYVDCSSGACVTIAARNHGYHLEELGLDYVDPQPILHGDEWYAGFDYKLRWIRDWMPNVSNVNRWDAYARLPYVISAEVAVDGTAAGGCLVWAGVRNPAGPVVPPRTKQSIERAIASLGDVRYIPGLVRGRPAPLRFYEDSVTTYQAQGLSLFSVLDITCR